MENQEIQYYYESERSDEEIDYEQIHQIKSEYVCQYCDQQFRISKSLFQHQTIEHKDQKISRLLANLVETEVLYSSDSDCDYTISVEVIKTPKLKSEYLANLEDADEDKQEAKHLLKIVDSDKLGQLQNNYSPIKSTKSEEENVKHQRVQCDHCSQTFTTTKILKQHIKLYHIQETGTIELDLSTLTKFNCPECFRELKGSRCLRKHLKLCHNLIVQSKRRRPPPIRVPCLKPSVVKGQLSDDFPIIRDRSPSSGKPRTKCGICGHGPVYGYTTIMKHQIRKHGRPKKKTNDVFICDFCTKQFGNKENLSRHLKIHENARRYECDLCTARFNTALLLSRHQRLHVYIRCGHCDQEFQFRSHYKSHHRTAHPKLPKNLHMMQQGQHNEIIVTKDIPKINSNEFVQICTSCNKQFRSKRGYKEHQCKGLECNEIMNEPVVEQLYRQKSKHKSNITSKFEEESCGTCARTFKSKKGFDNHRCREPKQVICPFDDCNTRFESVRDYFEHVELMHSDNPDDPNPVLIYPMEDGDVMQMHDIGVVESEIIISN